MVQSFYKVALPLKLRRTFTYLPPQAVDNKVIKVGMRVRVPFQQRSLIGIITAIEQSTEIPYDTLKSIQDVLDEAVLISDDLLKLARWAADYYHHPIGEVLMQLFPIKLRKANVLDELKSLPKVAKQTSERLALNHDQEHAVKEIVKEKSFAVFALNGVTGGGKTEVYLQVIEETLRQNKKALVLIPEISLTPQTIARFSQRFSCEVVSIHSGMSESKRYEAWKAAHFGRAQIVIGTRSAIFIPLTDLGIIVIDEEHDHSFKQQDRFHYHARDLAIMRAQINNIPIVLGSATLSLETLHNIKRKRYRSLNLPERAGVAMMPTFDVLDIRQAATCEEGISVTLLQEMKTQLHEGHQVMLFLNKRGFAPVLFCSHCSWTADCKNCATKLVYHQHPKSLRCHYCDARQSIPKLCPSCQQQTLMPIGLGTQKIEHDLMKHFPETPIVRIDRDNTRRKGSLNALLKRVHSEPNLILLGTQMLAKGHHFPNVAMVGLIDADSGLFNADFRAQEQLGQLIVQVAGRAGREKKQGRVLIQTRNPEHILFKTLIEDGYLAFAELLMRERAQVLLPPFVHLAVIRAEAKKEAQAQGFLSSIKEHYKKNDCTVLGPIPALLAKRKGYFCQHLLLKATNHKALHQAINEVLSTIEAMKSVPVRWVLDVDPISV